MSARLPLSPAQQRLWLAYQLAPASPAYLTTFAYRLTGALDAGALEGALGLVASRHDALRTRFAVQDGIPCQLIGETAELKLEIVDLPGGGGKTPWRGAADEPFDLTAGPPIQMVLYRLAHDEHVLLARIHHIVFDGWSHGIFIRELSQSYAALAAGDTPNMPPAPQYADFAIEKAADTAGGRTEAGLAYWRNRLAGAPERLGLQVARAQPGESGDAIRFTLPADVAAPLRQLARRRGATFFMVALAGYAALLARYAGADEVVVGVPAAGRTQVKWEGVIGFFINAMPLRIDLSANPPFSTLVRQVRDTVLDALANADVPFERIVAEVAPTRDPARHPVFQAWCDMFPPDPLPAFGSLAVEPVDAGTQVTPFDVGLHLTDEGSAVAVRLLHQPARYSYATMRRFTEHYRNLLAAVAADPDVRVMRAPILSPAERDRLIAIGTGPVAPIPERSLAEQVRAAAAATPEAIAVQHGDRLLRYRELNAGANRLASVLRDSGAAADTAIGLCLPRGIDLVVALLAIVKAGAGYLPIDPHFPAERIAFMLADSNPLLVLTEQALAERLPASVPRLCLDAERARIASAPAGDLPLIPGLDHLMYLIYTSGSTGRPKAVAMPQRPLLNLLAWQAARSEVTSPTAQFSSISFDASFLELFSTWVTGGRVVLIDELDRRDPERLLTVLTDAGVRRLFCPPLVIEQLARAAAGRDRLPPLIEFAPAGEQLRLRAGTRELLRRLGSPAVDNEYGPSETHVVTSHRMTGDQAAWPELPPIGRPVTNCEVYLLDRAGQLAPEGVAGEAYLGGQLAWGYLGRPELTAERFVPHPLAAEPGQRLYRSGDLARWLPDGTLDFLGRVDHQVKIRGFRVEPGEVEAALTSHPSVAQAVVVAWPVGDDLRLAGYVVPAAGAACDTSELDEYLRARLPDYLVPSYLIRVPRVPLTAIGKLDRDALPDPVASVAMREQARPDSHPRTRLERVIAGIWADVLGLPSVGIDQSFFTIGGHSLLAARAVARMRGELDADVPLALLFTHPTVAGLAAALPGQPETARRPVIPAADGKLQLSPAQQRMWFLDRLDPGSARYHLPMAYRISGPLRAEHLDQALALVIGRHDALRTRFGAGGNDEPEPVIDPAGPGVLDVIDVSQAADPAAAGHAQVLAAIEAPFDLASEPPLRALLVRLSAHEHLLAMVAHHIAFDGWSRRILRAELSAAYAAIAARGRPDLPRLPVSYADFAAWQRQLWTGERLDREIAHWRARLAGAPHLLDLPKAGPDGKAGHARPPGPIRRQPSGDQRAAATGAGQPGDLVHGAARRLRRGAVAARGHARGRRRHPGGQRPVPELEGVIGLFTNSIPLRMSGPRGTAFTELAERAREVTIDGLAHSDVPFERLVEYLAPARYQGRNPLFQTVFTLTDESTDDGLALPGLTCSEYGLGVAKVRLDTETDLIRAGAGLTGLIRYNAGLVDERAVDRLAADYAGALEAIAADPKARLA